MTTEDRSELHAASCDNSTMRLELEGTNVPACFQGDEISGILGEKLSAEVENLQTQVVLQDMPEVPTTLSSKEDEKFDRLDDDIFSAEVPIKGKVLEELDLPVSPMEPDYNVEEVVEESGSGDITNLFIKVLKTLGARFFKKLWNPMHSYIWFRDIERAMNILRVNEDEKVATAILLLGKSDLAWWLSVEKKYPVDKVITWSDFKKEFYHNFYTQAFIDEQRQEFFDLTQGPMSVRGYALRFAERSEFVLDILSTEAEKCKRFEQGLRQAIRDSIAAIKWSDYKQLVDIAIRVEEVLRRPDTLEAKKETKKRKRDEERSSKDQVSDRHGGPCSDNVRACHQCGQKGHMMAKCPSKGQKTQTAKQVPSRSHPRCDICHTYHRGNCQKAEQRSTEIAAGKSSQEQRSTKIAAGDDVAAEKPAEICEKGPVGCFECGQVGHYRYMCPLLVQPEKGEQRTPKKATVKSTKRRDKCLGAPAAAKVPICYRCRMPGHYSSKCPTVPPAAGSSGKTARSRTVRSGPSGLQISSGIP